MKKLESAAHAIAVLSAAVSSLPIYWKNKDVLVAQICPSAGRERVCFFITCEFITSHY